MTIERFEYLFEGTSHPCEYRVSGERISVVVSDMEAVGDLDRLHPDRVARILVHELLVQRTFAAARPDPVDQ